MSQYDKMTQEEFDALLEEIIGEYSPGELLMISGLYEVVAELFNNDVLNLWHERQG